MPILTEILKTFPFNVSGFHTDNVSEYINHKVAYSISDNEFADQMNLAKKRLFKQINEQKLA